jgi:hypothetical protein
LNIEVRINNPTAKFPIERKALYDAIKTKARLKRKSDFFVGINPLSSENFSVKKRFFTTKPIIAVVKIIFTYSIGRYARRNAQI